MNSSQIETHPTLDEGIVISYGNLPADEHEVKSPPRGVTFTLHNTCERSYYIRITPWEVGMPKTSEYRRLKPNEQWFVQYQYLSADCTLRIYREGAPNNILIQEIPVKQYFAGVIPSATPPEEFAEDEREVQLVSETSTPAEEDVAQDEKPVEDRAPLKEDEEEVNEELPTMPLSHADRTPLEEDEEEMLPEKEASKDVPVLRGPDAELLKKIVKSVVDDTLKKSISQMGEIEGKLVELQNTLESFPPPDTGNSSSNSAQDDIREYYLTLEAASKASGLLESTGSIPLVDEQSKRQLESIANVVNRLKRQINSSPSELSQDTEDLIDEFEAKLNDKLIASQSISCAEVKRISFPEYKKERIKDYCEKARQSDRKIPAPTYHEIEEAYKKYLDQTYQAHFSAQISPATIQPEDLDELIVYIVEAVDLLKQGDEEAADNMALLDGAIKGMLDTVGIEETPITAGKTIADEDQHDIYETRTGNYPNGVVLEILARGLQRRSNRRIIRKPTVVRGRRQ